MIFSSFSVLKLLVTGVSNYIYNKYEIIEERRLEVVKNDIHFDHINKELLFLVLRESWIDMPEILINDEINLILTNNGINKKRPRDTINPEQDLTTNTLRKTIIVDDSHNLVILHPRILISVSTVSDSFPCLRKACLSDIAKSSLTIPAVQGSMVHKLFETCLKESCYSYEGIKSIIENVIKQYLTELYIISQSINDTRVFLRSYISKIQGWHRNYCNSVSTPSSDRSVIISAGSNSCKVDVHIIDIVETEQYISSFTFGLKGILDAVMKVKFSRINNSHSSSSFNNYNINGFIPFELKTGKPYLISHRAQVVLYTLLMSEKYKIDVTSSLLFYISRKEMQAISAQNHEIRSLIIRRNEIAYYSQSNKMNNNNNNNSLSHCSFSSFPSILQKKNCCHSCYISDICKLHDELDNNEKNIKESSDIEQNLTTEDTEFFRNWNELIDNEYYYSSLKSTISVSAHIREQDIEDICRTSIDNNREIKDNSNIFYRIAKHNLFQLFMNNTAATRLRKQIISLYPPTFDYANTEFYTDHSKHHNSTLFSNNHQFMTHNTKLSNNNTISNNINNYINQSNPRNFEFDNNHKSINNNNNQSILLSKKHRLFETWNTLNTQQQTAVSNSLCAQDYACIQGMPGTGKTACLAFLIEAFISHGQRVLIATNTHSALDNLLMILLKKNISFIRLSNSDDMKIHSDILPFTLNNLFKSYSDNQISVNPLDHILQSHLVVGTTCLGAPRRPLLSKLHFEYCIIDEACQVMLPILIFPILCANKFILAGDPEQLPPIVHSTQNKKCLEICLFRLLSTNNPSVVTPLSIQYRMNDNIMLLSNTLIYHNCLVSGNQTIAQRILNLNHNIDFNSNLSNDFVKKFDSSIDSIIYYYINLLGIKKENQFEWLSNIINPSNSVLFLNTDTPIKSNNNNCEKQHDVGYSNTSEALIIGVIVDAFILFGIKSSQIGIISLYRKQVSEIQKRLSPLARNVEVHTVDSYQGRDKDCIILSFVRSNSDYKIGNLLRDKRRLNVSLSRAKRKLILIGSYSTLFFSNDSSVCSLLRILNEREWIYTIPRKQSNVININ